MFILVEAGLCVADGLMRSEGLVVVGGLGVEKRRNSNADASSLASWAVSSGRGGAGSSICRCANCVTLPAEFSMRS